MIFENKKFLIFLFLKNIRLGNQLLLKTFFENLIFKILCLLKTGTFFVGSVHNFSRFDNDMISEKMPISNRCIRDLMPKTIKKS